MFMELYVKVRNTYFRPKTPRVLQGLGLSLSCPPPPLLGLKERDLDLEWRRGEGLLGEPDLDLVGLLRFLPPDSERERERSSERGILVDLQKENDNYLENNVALNRVRCT